MTSRDSIAELSIQIHALRQAMESVRGETTPDHAKWTAAPNFARRYTEIALEYSKFSGDSIVKIFDVSKLKSWTDMLWPALKSMFDSVYTETLILCGSVDRLSAPIKSDNLYNLLVSGSGDDWSGIPFQIELPRCVREYTDPDITDRYGSLDKESVAELIKFPCIFAYESSCNLSPKFGYIREVVQRQGEVRIDYEIVPVDPYLTALDLDKLSFELDIGKLELYRTHWAVKEVNLPKELHRLGIAIPTTARDVINAVDISNHEFEVALSFPGEVRTLVEHIAQELERRLGPNSYFYDNNYTSQLAQPALDVLLQGIYSRAKLDVVFLSTDYQTKNWCGVEFRAIRDIIFARENSRVMFIRTDDGIVDGVFKTDGYVDARKFSPSNIAEFICERVSIISSN